MAASTGLVGVEVVGGEAAEHLSRHRRWLLGVGISLLIEPTALGPGLVGVAPTEPAPLRRIKATCPLAQKIMFSITILTATVMAADSSAEMATRIIVSRQVIRIR
jgi:hypothetical protein